MMRATGMTSALRRRDVVDDGEARARSKRGRDGVGDRRPMTTCGNGIAASVMRAPARSVTKRTVLRTAP